FREKAATPVRLRISRGVLNTPLHSGAPCPTQHRRDVAPTGDNLKGPCALRPRYTRRVPYSIAPKPQHQHDPEQHAGCDREKTERLAMHAHIIAMFRAPDPGARVARCIRRHLIRISLTESSTLTRPLNSLIWGSTAKSTRVPGWSLSNS